MTRALTGAQAQTKLAAMRWQTIEVDDDGIG
jgi:hypothetical protein